MRILDSTTDAELVLRLPGDAAAFEELFRRHRRSVVAYVARRCYQPADVADLVAADVPGCTDEQRNLQFGQGCFPAVVDRGGLPPVC